MIERIKRVSRKVLRGIGKVLGTRGRRRNIRALSSLSRPKRLKRIGSLRKIGKKEEDSQ
jgi:hypothetical protein